MYEKRTKLNHMVGEPKSYRDSSLKRLYLTLDEAQRLALLVCDVDKLAKHDIIYTGRKTKQTCATYDEETKRILIHIGHNNVHTILHELAHSASCNHGKIWRGTFARYIELWNNGWYEYFGG